MSLSYNTGIAKDVNRRFYFNHSGSGNQADANYHTFFSANNTITQTGWQQAVFTYDGSYRRIYLNGVEVANASKPGTIQDGLSPLVIGRTSNGATGYFKGKLDDIRIYNLALTASEVTALYNYEKP